MKKLQGKHWQDCLPTFASVWYVQYYNIKESKAMNKCAKETPLFDYFKYSIELRYTWYVADYAFTENVKDIGTWLGAHWITEQEEKELYEYNLKFVS